MNMPDAGIQTAHSEKGESLGLARAFGGKPSAEPKRKKRRVTRAVRELRERDGVDGRDLIGL